jgi:glycosyltransferase involved in cell wall biosynthesis
MLSIIICTLNEEHYLPKLLDTISTQIAPFNFEILVIDAGSTDNTEGVVQQYKTKLSFPLQFVAFNQRGIARQRNEGAKLAKHSQLLFLDADVVLNDEFLNAAMQQIQEKKLPITGTKLYAAETSMGFRAIYSFYSNIYLPVTRWFNPVIHGCSIFVTKELHNRIGGFKEGILFEDFRYGSDASAIFRPVLLTGKAYVRTSARRFYHFSPKAVGELVAGSFASFFQSGIDPSKMLTYEQNTGNHDAPRY